MNISMNAFTESLAQKGVRFTVLDDTHLSVCFKGENLESIKVYFHFGDDGTDVAIRVFSLCKVPENKTSALYYTCSRLNNDYRWTRFFLDSDDEVTAAMDATITPATAGPVCDELLRRMVQIVDDIYPIVMHMMTVR